MAADNELAKLHEKFASQLKADTFTGTTWFALNVLHIIQTLGALVICHLRGWSVV